MLLFASYVLSLLYYFRIFLIFSTCLASTILYNLTSAILNVQYHIYRTPVNQSHWRYFLQIANKWLLSHVAECNMGNILRVSHVLQ